MDQIYRQIVNLQHKCNDWMDDPSASSAKSLRSEVQRLEDEAQMGKNPQSLEHRARSVIRLLDEVGRSGAMSHYHADELIGQFENIANQLKRL